MVSAGMVRNLTGWMFLLAALAGVACSPTPKTLEVKPAFVRFKNLNHTETLETTILDEKGLEITGLPITWTSTDEKVAVVEKGKVIPKGSGTAIIWAAHKDVKGFCDVLVEIPHALVAPMRQANLKVGETISVFPKVLDAAGKELPTRNIIFYALNPGVVTITRRGLLTALKPGKTTVSAVYGSLKAQIDIEVTAED